jgi:hypothetical protein
VEVAEVSKAERAPLRLAPRGVRLALSCASSSPRSRARDTGRDANPRRPLRFPSHSEVQYIVRVAGRGHVRRCAAVFQTGYASDERDRAIADRLGEHIEGERPAEDDDQGGGQGEDLGHRGERPLGRPMLTGALVGNDTLAEMHARETIRKVTSFDGRDLSPMRTAEAQITLGVVAARRGDLDAAAEFGAKALDKRRVCGPSLLMVGSELDHVLRERYPGSQQAQDFHGALIDATREPRSSRAWKSLLSGAMSALVLPKMSRL